MMIVFDSLLCVLFIFWFFVCVFKQKTAYERRISDWSSDVCSSDLQPQGAERIYVVGVFRRVEADLHVALGREVVDLGRPALLDDPDQVGGVGHVAVFDRKSVV